MSGRRKEEGRGEYQEMGRGRVSERREGAKNVSKVGRGSVRNGRRGESYQSVRCREGGIRKRGKEVIIGKGVGGKG